MEGYLEDTTCNCTLYMWFNFIMFWRDIGLHTCLGSEDSVRLYEHFESRRFLSFHCFRVVCNIHMLHENHTIIIISFIILFYSLFIVSYKHPCRHGQIIFIFIRLKESFPILIFIISHAVQYTPYSHKHSRSLMT